MRTSNKVFETSESKEVKKVASLEEISAYTIDGINQTIEINVRFLDDNKELLGTSTHFFHDVDDLFPSEDGLWKLVDSD